MAKTAHRRHRHKLNGRIALLGGSSLANAALALLLIPGLILGTGAAAQTILPPAPPPAQPPGGPVAGPPDGAIPPGPPVRLPTPAPAPAPAPTPAPTPPPVSPARTPTPTPAPAPPREQRPAPARPAPTPQEPAAAAPADAPAGAAPSVAAPDEPAMLPATPTPEPAAVAEPDSDSALPSWWPYALAAALAALLGGWFALRRRRDHDAAPVPELAKAPTPSPQPSVKQDKKLGDQPKSPNHHPALLHASIEPLSASTTLVNLRLRYALVLTNPTDADITLTDHADTILAGSGAQENAIRHWFANARPSADISGIVPANGELRMDRELAVPLGQLNAMKVRDKAVLIPVLLLSLSYRHATGLGRIGRAFVIGKPGNADARLAALPLDQGMGGFGPLAARDTGIAQSI